MFKKCFSRFTEECISFAVFHIYVIIFMAFHRLNVAWRRPAICSSKTKWFIRPPTTNPPGPFGCKIVFLRGYVRIELQGCCRAGPFLVEL